MKGLFLKDLYVLENYRKGFLFQMVIVLAFAIFTRGGGTYLATILTLMAVSVVTATFTYDEASHWDRYAAAMPVRRGTVVNARYLFALLCAVGVMALSAMLTIGAGLAFGVPEVWITTLTVVFIELCIILLSLSVSLPVAFLLGPDKARVAGTACYIGIFALVGGAVLLLRGWLDGIMARLETMLPLLAGIAAAALVLLFAGSWLLSRRFYARRDF